MDKNQLLKLIALIFERNQSHSLVLRQLMDILKEQNAPQEYIDLVQYSVDGFNYIKDKVKENGFVTETDIREGERKYRKAREESAGRC